MKIKLLLVSLVLLLGFGLQGSTNAKGGGCYLQSWNKYAIAFRYRNAPKAKSYMVTFRLKNTSTGRVYVTAASSWARMGKDVIIAARYNFTGYNWKAYNLTCIAQGKGQSKNYITYGLRAGR